MGYLLFLPQPLRPALLRAVFLPRQFFRDRKLGASLAFYTSAGQVFKLSGAESLEPEGPRAPNLGRLKFGPMATWQSHGLPKPGARSPRRRPIAASQKEGGRLVSAQKSWHAVFPDRPPLSGARAQGSLAEHGAQPCNLRFAGGLIGPHPCLLLQTSVRWNMCNCEDRGQDHAPSSTTRRRMQRCQICPTYSCIFLHQKLDVGHLRPKHAQTHTSERLN